MQNFAISVNVKSKRNKSTNPGFIFVIPYDSNLRFMSIGKVKNQCKEKSAKNIMSA